VSTPGPERDERLARWDRAARPVILPSLLACDFARMGGVFEELDRAGVAAVHLDVMDGHFVPNLTFGPPVIARWRAVGLQAFDAHLMVSNPGAYIPRYVEAGCDRVLVHIEVLDDPRPVLADIRSRGCRAGLVLNPPTAVERIAPYLDAVDAVLVMSVMPGFGGQAFDVSALEKIRALRAARPGLPILVDGGIHAGTAGAVVAAGATELVAGTAVFGHPAGLAAGLAELEAAATGGNLS
jgi:ribulose-phosphate 3-epimerase